MNKLKLLAERQRSKQQPIAVERPVEVLNGTPILQQFTLPVPAIKKHKDELLLELRKIRKPVLEYVPFSLRSRLTKAKSDSDKVFTGKELIDILNYSKDIILDEVQVFFENIQIERENILISRLQAEKEEAIKMAQREYQNVPNPFIK